jgi:hypothetical protein
MWLCIEFLLPTTKLRCQDGSHGKFSRLENIRSVYGNIGISTVSMVGKQGAHVLYFSFRQKLSKLGV